MRDQNRAVFRQDPAQQSADNLRIWVGEYRVVNFPHFRIGSGKFITYGIQFGSVSENKGHGRPVRVDFFCRGNQLKRGVVDFTI